VPKIQSQKVSRKKAAQRLSYEKGARKMLMKLTPCVLLFSPASRQPLWRFCTRSLDLNNDEVTKRVRSPS